jgi:hypothetical protein
MARLVIEQSGKPQHWIIGGGQQLLSDMSDWLQFLSRTANVTLTITQVSKLGFIANFKLLCRKNACIAFLLGYKVA